MAATAPAVASSELTTAIAPGRGGRVVFAGGNALVGYLPDGQPDHRFGKRGRITVHAPAGTEFKLEAVATDSAGRVIVAGTSRSEAATGVSGPSAFLPGPPPSWATVTRYLPNGRRDTGFASNGTLSTTFDLPSPFARTFAPNDTTPFEYATTSVSATGLVVDGEDRPVVTGAYAEWVTTCYPGVPTTLDASYITRLTASGSPDPGFNGTGLLRMPEVNYVAPLAASPGRFTYLSIPHTQCQRVGRGPGMLGALGEDGRPDPSFGAGGSVALGEIDPWAIDAGRGGAIYVAGPQSSIPTTEPPPEHLVRFSPSGAWDVDFGTQGAAGLPLRMAVSAIATDSRGRILLAGSTGDDSHSDFALARLNANGERDRSFGRGGLIRTSFGRQANAQATQILVDAHGRILVGGVVDSHRFATGKGVALVRYLGGK